MLTPQCLCNVALESTNGEMQLSKESRAERLVQLYLYLQIYKSFSKKKKQKQKQNILCRFIMDTEKKCINYF